MPLAGNNPAKEVRVSKRKTPTPTFGAVVYHDEPGEAADDQRFLGMHPSVNAATGAIREALGEYWHYGSIHYGFRVERISGPDFESDDREVPWQVGPDYVERG
jgi:hypothetical protein